MSLENAINKCTETMEKLIEIMAKQPAANDSVNKKSSTKATPKADAKPKDDTTSEIKLIDVQKELIGLAEKHGRPAVKKILTKFKAAKIQDVKESDYAKVMAMCEKKYAEAA